MVLLETWWDVKNKAVVKVMTTWYLSTAALLDLEGHTFTVTCNEKWRANSKAGLKDE